MRTILSSLLLGVLAGAAHAQLPPVEERIPPPPPPNPVEPLPPPMVPLENDPARQGPQRTLDVARRQCLSEAPALREACLDRARRDFDDRTRPAPPSERRRR